MRTRVTVLLLSGLVLAASACGSSSTNTGSPAPSAAPTTAAVTKAAFVEQANAICKQMSEKSKEIAASYPGGKPSNDAEAVEMLNKGLDVTAEAVTKIKALPQPTEDSAALTTAYADIDAAIAAGRQMGTALSSGDTAQAQAFSTELDAAQKKANASANAYGLTECGKS